MIHGWQFAYTPAPDPSVPTQEGPDPTRVMVELMGPEWELTSVLPGGLHIFKARMVGPL